MCDFQRSGHSQYARHYKEVAEKYLRSILRSRAKHISPWLLSELKHERLRETTEIKDIFI